MVSNITSFALLLVFTCSAAIEGRGCTRLTSEFYHFNSMKSIDTLVLSSQPCTLQPSSLFRKFPVWIGSWRWRSRIASPPPGTLVSTGFRRPDLDSHPTREGLGLDGCGRRHWPFTPVSTTDSQLKHTNPHSAFSATFVLAVVAEMYSQSLLQWTWSEANSRQSVSTEGFSQLVAKMWGDLQIVPWCF